MYSLVIAVAVAATLLVAACGEERGAAIATEPLPRTDQHVELDPAEFTTEIDNPYLPMTPGDQRVYRVTDPEGTRERAVATVTHDTKTIANGIAARVVYTTVAEDGEMIEDNRAWYAQDSDGNVWYLGERGRELKRGRMVAADGSWEAGVDGAEPGVLMPADPTVGLAYREEQYAGVAEDRGEVFSLDERAETPLGRFRDVLMIKETEGIERSLLDFKFYAHDVGLVLGIEVSGGGGREELVAFEPGSAG